MSSCVKGLPVSGTQEAFPDFKFLLLMCKKGGPWLQSEGCLTIFSGDTPSARHPRQAQIRVPVSNLSWMEFKVKRVVEADMSSSHFKASGERCRSKLLSLLSQQSNTQLKKL